MAERTLLKIETCKRSASDGFHACFADNKGMWGQGRTITEAIGDLVITHAAEIGLMFTHLEDERR